MLEPYMGYPLNKPAQEQPTLLTLRTNTPAPISMVPIVKPDPYEVLTHKYVAKTSVQLTPVFLTSTHSQ